jgi:hypothetical protein
MMDWQVVMPWVGPEWTLRECFASMGAIDVPFLMVDNSPDGASKNMELGVEAEFYPFNLGIAASWNRGLDYKARWTLILSASMRFGKGLTHFIEEASHWANDFGLYTNCGFHCVVIGKETVSRVGAFDENIWPAYKEDSDAMRRMKLAGIELPQYRDPNISFAGDAIAVRSGAVPDQCAEQRCKYYMDKWGGVEHSEKFTHPFGNPDLPLSFWPVLEKPGRPYFY